MCVQIESLGIVYMPIPKAACTSVKAACSAMDPDALISEDELKAKPILVHRHYKTSRYRAKSWRKYGNGSWFRFTVIRDPLQRLLSVYTDRVVGRQVLQHSRGVKRNKGLPSDPDPDYFFQNLDQYRQNSSDIKHHAFASQMFIGPKPLSFDRVYTTAELGLLADDLSEKAGKKVEIPRLNKSREKLELSDLAPKTIVALYLTLQDEYEHLGEYFENPFV